PILRMQHVPETRASCDICAASFHMGSYMCGCCGREYCMYCYNNWQPSATIVAGKLSRMDQCSRKRRHAKQSMIFVTRALPGHLESLLCKLFPDMLDFSDQRLHRRQSRESVQKLPTVRQQYPHENGPLYLAVPTLKHQDMGLEQFQSLWSAGGIPLVLTGVKSRFQLPWDDTYFVDEHGMDKCIIHDCSTGLAAESTVAEFFKMFRSGENTRSLKLKDWPPTDTFQSAFPDLFADFENAVPIPEYTRRTGPMNLASYFPEHWNAPDLGPKMYHATPSKEKRMRKLVGTTNLHLDLTDAVNIMLYETGGENAPQYSTVEKGIPECGAIWDIFRPEDASKIRGFLKLRDPECDDPIHRQCHYLSEHDLSLLAKEGVGSYRIYQRAGDAVFIPAGCAHQVRNRRSCVKVAVDFLSPENLERCYFLLREGMAMAPKYSTNRYKEKSKEDVLQLWNCLDFAFQGL
ncbi:hypothetical protein FN846DRAFT_769761, partial [Sphaerosporella brunnea]